MSLPTQVLSSNRFKVESVQVKSLIPWPLVTNLTNELKAHCADGGIISDEEGNIYYGCHVAMNFADPEVSSMGSITCAPPQGRHICFTVRVLSPDGKVKIYAGPIGVMEGTGTMSLWGFDCRKNRPKNLILGHRHRIIGLVGDYERHLAGRVEPGNSDGCGNEARFNRVKFGCFTHEGDIIFTDSLCNKVRKLELSNQKVTTFGLDMHGKKASFDYPWGITCYDGSFFVTDAKGIQKIAPDGGVSLFCELEGATAISADPLGNFIVLTSSKVVYPGLGKSVRLIKKISRDGSQIEVIRQIHKSTTGLCIDPFGNVYFSDGDLHRISPGTFLQLSHPVREPLDFLNLL